jgi:hypothetical protein
MEHAVDLRLALDHKLHQVLHIHPLVRGLLELKLIVGVLAQQVTDVL